MTHTIQVIFENKLHEIRNGMFQYCKRVYEIEYLSVNVFDDLMDAPNRERSDSFKT